jgi:hypothetical protein
VTGPDLAGYLVTEFRAASTREYKLAILDRLAALSPATLKPRSGAHSRPSPTASPARPSARSSKTWKNSDSN